MKDEALQNWRGSNLLHPSPSLRDSLMHWRSYCPRESGVAIGFRTECLRNAELDEKRAAGMVIPPSGFGRIKYLDASNVDSIDDVIRYCSNLAKETLANNSNAKQENIGRYFDWALSTVACTSKHKSFEIESEYRLLLTDIQYRENNLRFRPVSSSLIPYVAMRVPSTQEIAHAPVMQELSWDAIADVTIGPTPNMELTKRSLSAFIKLRGISASILCSEIPFRDW